MNPESLEKNIPEESLEQEGNNLTFEAAGQKFTFTLPEGGVSGGLAEVQETIQPDFYNEHKEEIIDNFRKALIKNGKRPRQSFYDPSAKKLSALYLHR